MVGRISLQKAPDVFIRAAKLIKREIPNAHFIIVGSGEMEDDVKKYAKQNGLEDCLHITGWVDDPLDYVELFDVACLLSRWEGFGLVLSEYMMVGKPIVVSNVNVIPNIIRDGENGILADVDNPQKVCDSVLKFYCYPQLREKMVDCGKKDVYLKFNAKRVADEHEKLFEEMEN